MADNSSMSDELPSYMYAADVHNIANGKPSMVPDSTYDTLDHLTKGSLSVIARAVTSTVNILPAATNWAGLTDVAEWKTEDLLSSFDDDLSAYYSQYRDTLDVVGDVVSSVVPGMVGIKALNYAQVSLKGLSRGSAGRNILQSIGALPDATTKYAAEGISKMASSGNTFNMIESNALKAFGGAYAQNALEFAAFETAAAVALGDRSPLFKDHTALDILQNAAMGGGVVGMGVLGTMSAVQTYGAFNKARKTIDRVINPARYYESTEGLNDPVFSQILGLHAQRANPPKFEGGVVTAGDKTLEVAESAFNRTLETRQRTLGLKIQELITDKMAGGNPEVGKLFASSIETLAPDAAWAAMLHAQEVGLAGGKALKLEERLKLAEDAKFFLADTTGMTPQMIAKYTKDAANAEVNAVKYLTLRGENAGVVTVSRPAALGLADKFTKAEIAQKVKEVGDLKLGIEWTPLGKSLDDVEARYIAAAETQMFEGQLLHSTDLPGLEAAYAKGIQRVVVDGMEMDSTQLLRHIKETKNDLLGISYADALAPGAELSTTEMAKRLNVNVKLIEGGHKGDGSEFFGVLSGAELREPSMLKIAYTGNPETVGVTGDVLSGMATIKELQEIAISTARIASSHVLGAENAAMMPVLKDVDVLAATSAGAGAGLVSFASGAYQTIASKVEWIGKLTNMMKTARQKETNDLLQPSMYKVLQKPEVGLEVAAIRHKIVSTGEKYILEEGGLVHKSVAAYEQQVMIAQQTGKTFRGVEPELGKDVVERIAVSHPETMEFLEAWVAHNDDFLSKQKTLRQAIGKDTGAYGGEVYFPQPDSRKFTHFSMVVPKNRNEAEKVQMLWGADAAQLAEMEAKVPAHYTILRKSDTELYHKAVKDFDYELGFHSTSLNHDLTKIRTGVAAPFFPKTDAQTLMQEMLDWRHRMSDMQIREGVTLHNQMAFSELRRLDDDYRALQTSTKKTDTVASPFGTYVQTALDIPAGTRGLAANTWNQFNNLAENAYSKVHKSVADAWTRLRSPEDIAGINKILDDNGIRGFQDALTEMTANHPAGGKELSKFVMSSNSVLSTLILRTDPMNALNNGVGSMVITGAETSSLLKMIKGMGGDFESELLAKAFVGVPGSKAQSLSSPKLIASAYADYFKMLAGNPELKALEAKFSAAGYMPSMQDQMRSVMDHVTLSGFETAGEIAGKTKSMLKETGDLLEKFTLNRSVEEMNRFVSAHIAESLSGIAVKGGKMTEAEQYAFVNTFVNRTQGNYLASQRPLMFQGPVGHAISLFQTYSFNMMQHVFRRVEAGDKKQLAVLMGLQSSLYGFQGLPAFDFMNRHLVGMAAGNTSNSDVISTFGGPTDTGADVGNWLLYGGLSNATGLGLYARGDLNPRHLTILPNSLGDVPFISATRTAFGSMVTAGSEMLAGADIGSTFLRGIEHAGLSRPLAGLATTMQGLGSESGQGYTTTGKGGMMQAFDMYSLQTLGRIAGSRPLDEAITRDAYHRVQVYDSHRQGEVAVVGSAIRDKVRGGKDIAESDVHGFLQEYVHKGGNQKDFIKFYQSQVKKANVSQVNQMVSHMNTPQSMYLQKLLPGTAVDDLSNQGQGQGE